MRQWLPAQRDLWIGGGAHVAVAVVAHRELRIKILHNRHLQLTVDGGDVACRLVQRRGCAHTADRRLRARLVAAETIAFFAEVKTCRCVHGACWQFEDFFRYASVNFHDRGGAAVEPQPLGLGAVDQVKRCLRLRLSGQQERIDEPGCKRVGKLADNHVAVAEHAIAFALCRREPNFVVPTRSDSLEACKYAIGIGLSVLLARSAFETPPTDTLR